MQFRIELLVLEVALQREVLHLAASLMPIGPLDGHHSFMLVLIAAAGLQVGR